MFHEFNIPFEWTTRSYNFITYHGDIYPGNIVFCDGYKDGFFIIPNINMGTLREMEAKDKTPEAFRNLGWEIKDISIIQYRPIPSTQDFGAMDNSEGLWRSGDHKWKKMFVFGAGASAFCCFGENKDRFMQSTLRPPIGTDILHQRYDEVIQHYPGANQILSEFESNGWDIEACMQREWDLAKDSFNKRITTRHINIQYCLSELFRKISHETVIKYQRGNLYSLFALKLQAHLSKKKNTTERVGIVSFNYDTILDEFIESNFAFNYTDMSNYIDWIKKQVVLFKPHGSCNWGWQFKPGKIPTQYQSQVQISQYLYNSEMIPAKIYYELLGDLNTNVHSGAWAWEKTTHPKDVGRYTINKNRIKIFSRNTNGFFPAMLMPYKDKDEFLMPYNHIHALSQWLEQIEEICFIGWKGNEDSFNTYLQKHAGNLRKIIIVNPEAKTVRDNLAKVLNLEKYSIDEISTFEEFVRQRMDSMLDN